MIQHILSFKTRLFCKLLIRFEDLQALLQRLCVAEQRIEARRRPSRLCYPPKLLKWLVRSLNEYVTYKKYDILYRMVARLVHV